MAFLCPVRIGRTKRKTDSNDKIHQAPSLGRITGSASIETLVRVGLEKEHGLSPDSKVVVLHDFTPCVDDELRVRRGQIVNVLYQENDWVYVIASDGGEEGFIPHSYCAPFGSQMAELALMHSRRKLPRDPGGPGSGGTLPPGIGANAMGGSSKNGGTLLGESAHSLDSGGVSDSESNCGGALSSRAHGGAPSSGAESNVLSGSSSGVVPDVHPFFKDPAGRYIVLYTFVARDENDLSVERGELVTVLNRDDQDWFWVVRSDGQEGFVPSAFVYPADVVQEHSGKGGDQAAALLNNNSSSINQNNPNPNNPGANNVYHATNLIFGNDTNSAPEDDDLVVGFNDSGDLPPLNGGSVGTKNGALKNQNGGFSSSTATNNGGFSIAGSNNGASNSNNNNGGSAISGGGAGSDDQQSQQLRRGTELVLLYDYNAQATDDLTVRRGDWVYADMSQQTVNGWLWAYAPKLKKYGFIPRAYTQPPAMTSL